jgi:hypothetical protein
MGNIRTLIGIRSGSLTRILTATLVQVAILAEAQYAAASQPSPELGQHQRSTSSLATNTKALYDSAPVPYCNITFDSPGEYNWLESQVISSNPECKSLAQFVLEAFAQANANNSLLDSQSETDVVVALNRLQAMWVPSQQNFKTYYMDKGVTETDAVDFIIEQLIQVPYRFPKLLAQYGPVGQTGTIENLLSTLFPEGQAGELNHTVDASYTNVFLTKVCNLILLGQGSTDGSGHVLIPEDSLILDTGRTDLFSWVATVRTYGIHEFLSPIYTGVDLEMLGNIELFARDPGIAMIAEQGFREAWIDIYCDWFKQDQRLGGTHSRTYEFLTDENWTTDRYIYAASNPTTVSSPAWPSLLTSRNGQYWHGQDFTAYVLPPPSDVPNLFPAQVPRNGTRTIIRDFGDLDQNLNPSFMYVENYMANPLGNNGLSYPFSVGSAQSPYYDDTFEGFTTMLPGDGTTTNLNFNMQGRDDPYLQAPAADGKSDTLEPYIASVQNGPEVLFFATSSAADDTRASSVASTIVVPNSAQVWVGNSSSPENLSPGQKVSLSAGSTIFIQTTNPGQSDALITGIRFLLSTSMNGNPTNLSLVNDGSLYNALRVTCVHSGSTPTGGNAVIAFWSRTEYSPDLSATFNAIRSAMTSASVTSSYSPSSGEVMLSVPGLNKTMSVQANTNTQTTFSLSGGDLDNVQSLPLLTVNGTEYLSTTIQDWTSQDIGNATGGNSSFISSDGLYTGQIQATGAGSDIWGTADGFQFYYQKLTGDGTLIGRLRNMPTGNKVNPWAKAGLMLRNDLTPGSTTAFVSLDGSHGQRFSVRTVENGTSARSGNSITAMPYWFKLTRVANTFTSYSSPDGVNWTQIASPVNIPMSSTIYAGIGVTSCDPSNPITPRFDFVGIRQQSKE